MQRLDWPRPAACVACNCCRFELLFAFVFAVVELRPSPPPPPHRLKNSSQRANGLIIYFNKSASQQNTKYKIKIKSIFNFDLLLQQMEKTATRMKQWDLSLPLSKEKEAKTMRKRNEKENEWCERVKSCLPPCKPWPRADKSRNSTKWSQQNGNGAVQEKEKQRKLAPHKKKIRETPNCLRVRL